MLAIIAGQTDIPNVLKNFEKTHGSNIKISKFYFQNSNLFFQTSHLLSNSSCKSVMAFQG